jgi:septum formation protein
MTIKFKVCDGKVFEKPKDKTELKEMLEKYSSCKTHKVLTACYLVTSVGHSSFVESTDIVFGPIHPSLLESYLESDEPYDKAGGYGYQGIASCFIERINGCYYNVVGFPLYRFVTFVQTLKFEIN